jgi:hypothetical protein
MSWFRRRPIVKEPPSLSSHRHSPAAERLLREAKESSKPTIIPPVKKVKK